METTTRRSLLATGAALAALAGATNLFGRSLAAKASSDGQNDNEHRRRNERRHRRHDRRDDRRDD